MKPSETQSLVRFMFPNVLPASSKFYSDEATQFCLHLFKSMIVTEEQSKRADEYQT